MRSFSSYSDSCLQDLWWAWMWNLQSYVKSIQPSRLPTLCVLFMGFPFKYYYFFMPFERTTLINSSELWAIRRLSQLPSTSSPTRHYNCYGFPKVGACLSGCKKLRRALATDIHSCSCSCICVYWYLQWPGYVLTNLLWIKSILIPVTQSDEK